MSDGIRFLKGHGTENDFVLLPDADGRAGEPSRDLVRALCDRHAGIGADGVIRVVRTDATDDPAAVSARGEATWFMDYRNADGSLSEMCGNGVRVMGRYLVDREGVDPSVPLPIATRAGVKVLAFEDGRADGDITVDMGNPHAVAFVDDLETLSPPGRLLDEPDYDHHIYPDGVNVEYVVRRGEGHVAMRVHERGSGETRSCGTGACAVMVASALADGVGPGASYDVDLPGGTLTVEWTDDDRILTTGPSVLVAEGYWLAGC